MEKNAWILNLQRNRFYIFWLPVSRTHTEKKRLKDAPGPSTVRGLESLCRSSIFCVAWRERPWNGDSSVWVNALQREVRQNISEENFGCQNIHVANIFSRVRNTSLTLLEQQREYKGIPTVKKIIISAEEFLHITLTHMHVKHPLSPQECNRLIYHCDAPTSFIMVVDQ